MELVILAHTHSAHHKLVELQNGPMFAGKFEGNCMKK